MNFGKSKRNLSQSEQQVYEYLMKDYNIYEIAEILKISHHTVKSLVVSIGRLKNIDII